MEKDKKITCKTGFNKNIIVRHLQKPICIYKIIYKTLLERVFIKTLRIKIN